METKRLENEIDQLTQATTDLVEKLNVAGTIVEEDFSGGTKNLVRAKLREIMAAIKRVAADLTEAKSIVDGTSKSLKKQKVVKNASDLWSLLK